MIDDIALLTLGGCVALYRLLLAYRCRHPATCTRTALDQLYENWIETRLKEAHPITGVQALRNLIMSNQIFITSLIVLLGIIVVIPSAETTLLFGIAGLTVSIVRISTIVIAIFICVFFFTMSVRMAMRTTLLITSNPHDVHDEKIDGILVTKKAFNATQNHWMYGVRGVLYLISVLTWIVTPWLFLFSTVLVTVYLIVYQDIWSMK